MAYPVKLEFENCSEKEKTAVMNYLEKWIHNRFRMRIRHAPRMSVDLCWIRDNKSTISECKNDCIRKVYLSQDIKHKQVDGTNLELRIIENHNMAKGFVCCIMKQDDALFATRFNELLHFGRTVKNGVPYLPKLCLVMQKDANGLECWYRAKCQQILENDLAQVGLFDFGLVVNVNLTDIRLFDERFNYECISLECKIRNEFANIDLLDVAQFDNYAVIHAEKVGTVGASGKTEIYLSDDYFINEQDFL